MDEIKNALEPKKIIEEFTRKYEDVNEEDRTHTANSEWPDGKKIMGNGTGGKRIFLNKLTKKNKKTKNKQNY